MLKDLACSVAESGALITTDDLPTLLSNPLLLKRLFLNLIINAIKFRSPDIQPQIHISVKKEDASKHYVFSVRDNGIGIAPQHQPRIFEMFKRLHREQDYPGNGLGLAICQKIVERHGGKIWVESESGNGSE